MTLLSCFTSNDRNTFLRLQISLLCLILHVYCETVNTQIKTEFSYNRVASQEKKHFLWLIINNRRITSVSDDKHVTCVFYWETNITTMSLTFKNTENIYVCLFYSYNSQVQLCYKNILVYRRKWFTIKFVHLITSKM